MGDSFGDVAIVMDLRVVGQLRHVAADRARPLPEYPLAHRRRSWQVPAQPTAGVTGTLTTPHS
jgi:hypothetical protein